MKHSLEEMANKVKENSHTVKQKIEKMSIERKKKKKGNLEVQSRSDSQLTSSRKKEKTETRVNYQSENLRKVSQS